MIALTNPNKQEVASARESKPEKGSRENGGENTGCRAHGNADEDEHAYYDGQRDAQYDPFLAILRDPSAHLKKASAYIERT